jgi:prepilin-type processing-associated H-X9-DG protein
VPAWASAGRASGPKVDPRILGFRHGGYRKANFMMLDGHLEVLGPNDEVLSQRRFNFKGDTHTDK